MVTFYLLVFRYFCLFIGHKIYLLVVTLSLERRTERPGWPTINGVSDGRDLAQVITALKRRGTLV